MDAGLDTGAMLIAEATLVDGKTAGELTEELAQIGARLGPFDLALVPMGAYAPEAALGDVHADPEDALAIARDLGAWRALGMHWGTFAMSMASPAEGRQRFLDAAGPGLPLPLIADIGQTIAIHP